MRYFSGIDLSKEYPIGSMGLEYLPTPETNMTMEKQPFEDVSPILKMCVVVLLSCQFSGVLYIIYIYKIP